MTTAAALAELAANCRADSDYFSRVILARESTPEQLAFSIACDSNRRVNCRSGNGTGKSYRAGAKIIEKALCNENSRTLITGPSFEQARDGIWQEVKRAFEASIVPLPGVMLDSEWHIKTGWEVKVANPKRHSSVHGYRGHGGATFVWVDESQAVEEDGYWNALETICQDPSAFMCAMGNPLWPQGRFFANLRDPNWCNVKLSCFDHPNVGGYPEGGITEEWAKQGVQVIPNAVSRLWIYERFIQWGEDDPDYIARVLGEFPDAGALQLFPLKSLDLCAACKTGIIEEPRAGLDCARNPGTGDRNAIIILDHRRCVIFAECWHDDDLMRTKDRYIKACRNFGVPAHRCNADVGGIGAGVIDQSKRDGFELVPVNFGAGVNHAWDDLVGSEAVHQNLKAELYHALQHMFRRGLIGLPNEPRFRAIRADLAEIRREPGPVMKIEDKDKTRKRIGRSPDYADALAVAIYQGAFRTPSAAEVRRVGRLLGV